MKPNLTHVIIATTLALLQQRTLSQTVQVPKLNITSAVQVWFISEESKVYRLEKSLNLVDWSVVENQVYGNGVITRAFPADSERRFWRLSEIIPAYFASLPRSKGDLDGHYAELRLLARETGEDLGAIYITFQGEKLTLDFRNVGGTLESPYNYSVQSNGTIVDIAFDNGTGKFYRFHLTCKGLSPSGPYGAYVAYYGFLADLSDSTADEIDVGTFRIRSSTP